MDRNTYRFSLIELLVVVAVIALLCALLLPALQKAKGTALSSQCQSNLNQCGVGTVGYANDFNDWVVCGSCSTGTDYTSLAAIMMGFGYAPNKCSNGHIFSDCVNFGQVFQCPALPPPPVYKYVSTEMPYNGVNSYTWQSYGVRSIYYAYYYPGEKQSSSATNQFERFIKLPTLYQPTRMPFMVDSCANAPDSSGNVVGQMQERWWVPSLSSGTIYAGALHLRHSRRANCWFPDGHVGSWGAADTREFTVPGTSSLSTTPIGFHN